ncbi:MAG: YqcC family protein [Gammaproteobacteria bacterium]|nr:YqcC family protein [Gammaproteobacteria bacterium]
MTLPAMKRLEHTLKHIEGELQSLGLWEEEQPPIHDLQSQMPFCYDTLRLPQWLQWVFLPRWHQVIQTRDSIPKKSDIHSIAEYYFKEAGINAKHLLISIRRFDDLITEWNGPEGRRH